MGLTSLSTVLDVYCQLFWRHISAFEIPVIVVVAAAFLTNYVYRVARKPELICNPRHPLSTILASRMPTLKDKYWPTFWCYQAHFTTIFRSLFKGNPWVPYESETLTTTDGGHVKLDWVNNHDSPYEDQARPIVLFLPGISGGSDENYILHLVRECMDLGYRAAVLNYRGLGGLKLRTPRIYNSTNTEDLHIAVCHIQARFPNAPKMAVGCSLGGMLLFNYLSVDCKGLTVGIDKDVQNPSITDFGTLARGCPFLAAMTISCVWDPFEASKSLEEPLNWFLFNRHLKGNLCKLVNRNREVLASSYDVDYVLASRTIRDYDERLTHKMFGYTSNDAYYRASVLRDRLHQIKCCPLVCLNAVDDPFCPAVSLPVAAATKSDNVALVLTDFGGHIGFIEGVSPYGPNFADRLFRQLASNIFSNVSMKE